MTDDASKKLSLAGRIHTELSSIADCFAERAKQPLFIAVGNIHPNGRAYEIILEDYTGHENAADKLLVTCMTQTEGWTHRRNNSIKLVPGQFKHINEVINSELRLKGYDPKTTPVKHQYLDDFNYNVMHFHR